MNQQPNFNPESQVVPCDPDPTDPGSPVAYVCGIPVVTQEEVQHPHWTESGNGGE